MSTTIDVIPVRIKATATAEECRVAIRKAIDSGATESMELPDKVRTMLVVDGEIVVVREE